MPETEPDLTAMLARWSSGDADALDRLAPVVFDELRRLARAHLAGERRGHTLQPTALVNEVFMRLMGRRSVQWQNRAQFFQCATEMMRRILVDHARRHQAAKRGAGAPKLSLETVAIPSPVPAAETLALHEALETLGRDDPRCRQIVELKFYFGLTHAEIGSIVGLAASTVKQKWAASRVRLHQQIRKQ